jgi:hypothetical protein
MTAAHWSPAELRHQRLVVRRIALRAEGNRLRFAAARRGFAARVRTIATSPLVIAGCVLAGYLLLRPSVRRKHALTATQAVRGVRNAAATIAWLTQIYRQFMSGVAAGAALRERAAQRAEHPAAFEENTDVDLHAA